MYAFLKDLAMKSKEYADNLWQLTVSEIKIQLNDCHVKGDFHAQFKQNLVIC